MQKQGRFTTFIVRCSSVDQFWPFSLEVSSAIPQGYEGPAAGFSMGFNQESGWTV